ncbi:hypothetical protein [Halosegnis marinus]|uniref:hypothetical protein n=1 Tax=Halosegnis marinus TaxID=3034023 RepID=UPI00360A2C35
MRGIDDDEEVERALRYLVDSFESSGDNPKPVILHSTRVGMDLYDRGTGPASSSPASSTTCWRTRP